MKRIALALAVALLFVIASTARGDTLSVLQQLSDLRLSPAPLVFTRIPPAMPPYLQAFQNAGGARSKHGYAIRVAHYTQTGQTRSSRSRGATTRTSRPPSANSVALTLHGTSNLNGEACDTGQMTVTATPFHQTR